MNIKRFMLVSALASLAVFAGSRYVIADPVGNRARALELVAQFIAAENTQNVTLFDNVFTVNYIQHNPDVPAGLAGVKSAFAPQFTFIKAHHVPFHASVENVAVDGDIVVLREMDRYKNKGKWYEARSINEWRIVDGKFGEHWDSDTAPRVVATRP